MNDEKSDDLETLFAWRIGSERARFWRDIVRMGYILIGLFVGFAAFGGVQYAICTTRDPETTVMQCFRHEVPRSAVKGRR